MRLLTEYEIDLVLSHHFHNHDAAINTMKKAIAIYWNFRGNKIARSRIMSAIKIIKSIRKKD
ncbi:hypothetical protein LH87_18350 [Citrobacter braakii]|nr:hypothetical protein LH87_18350 [Citrobacter braakii]